MKEATLPEFPRQPWPEKLEIKPLAESSAPSSTDGSEAADSISFSILSFNVLAESYLTPRSHNNLPPSAAEVVFNKELRRNLLKRTLEKLAKSFDIICLQEVDNALRDIIVDSLTKLGYSYVYAPRGGVPLASSDVDCGTVSPSKSPQVDKRSDGCATFFSKNNWKCVNYSVVHFDDLADEERPPLRDDSVANSVKQPHPVSNSSRKRKKKQNALSGIIASYKRRNAALLLELEQIQSPSKARRIVVANAHLYWHPGYEYVKLSQAHYMLQKVKQFILESMELRKNGRDKNNEVDDTPVAIICGDMNSKPNSAVHSYFTKGDVDARTVAPWHFRYDEVGEQEELALQMQSMTVTSDGVINEVDLDQDPVVDLGEDGDSQNVDQDEGEDDIGTVHSKDGAKIENDSQRQTELPAYDSHAGELSGVQPVKYLLDVTLNKFTRWLRILGQDAALETAEEERLRTGEGEM